MEQAVELPRKRTPDRGGVTIDGVFYKSKAKACEAYGIGWASVDERMRKGMTLEDAIRTPRDFRRVLISVRDIASFSTVCDECYALIKCRVCGLSVMLPMSEAKLFEHSGKCVKYEWIC